MHVYNYVERGHIEGRKSDYFRTNKKMLWGRVFVLLMLLFVFHGTWTLIIFSKLLFFFFSRKPFLKKK